MLGLYYLLDMLIIYYSINIWNGCGETYII